MAFSEYLIQYQSIHIKSKIQYQIIQYHSIIPISRDEKNNTHKKSTGTANTFNNLSLIPRMHTVEGEKKLMLGFPPSVYTDTK